MRVTPGLYILVRAAGKILSRSMKEKLIRYCSNGDIQKTKTVKRAKAFKISKAKGKVTYKKISGSKKITVNKKNGNVTIKKGLKKGTYKVKVKVQAAGDSVYAKSKAKTVTVTVKVI